MASMFRTKAKYILNTCVENAKFLVTTAVEWINFGAIVFPELK